MKTDDQDRLDSTTGESASRPSNRGFILGNMSLAHGASHAADQGLPVLMPTISVSLGMSDFQV